MELSLAYSTCPNDTFLFEALANLRLDTGLLQFTHHLADVEELNRQAMAERYDITKLSFNAWLHVAGKYQILPTGSALGRGNGPLLVAKPGFDPDDLNKAQVAIPGTYTTANMLMKLAFPAIAHTKEVLFSDVMEEVISGRVDAGILIHETRFTFRERGLVLIQDLGAFWEEATGSPIPLGCIAVHRRIPHEIRVQTDQLLRQSLQQANSHPDLTIPYMTRYAQEMDPVIMQKHVKTFVTGYTEDLGEEGREAIRKLINQARQHGIIEFEPVDPVLTGSD